MMPSTLTVKSWKTASRNAMLSTAVLAQWKRVRIKGGRETCLLLLALGWGNGPFAWVACRAHV